MNEWTNGYVSDLNYTYGYYPELNPLQAQLKLLFAGIKPPQIKNACELGFGQGISLLSNCAASEINWYGTDFNPDQASFAIEGAVAAGLNVKLYDDDFRSFASRRDLPKFDYIGLHGIWSWISEENREVILRFIRENLNVGGLVYISYNSSPGRLAMQPVRELMTLHSSLMSAESERLADRIASSIEFVEALNATDPKYVRMNPTVPDNIKELKGLQQAYLAHEYFNKDWKTMSFAEVSDLLSEAKLKFAGPANAVDHLVDINFTKEQLKIIKSIDHLAMREVVKDFCSNQGFRREYWVKGARRLLPTEKVENLLRLNITLSCASKDVELKVQAGLGDANLSEKIYAPILKKLDGKRSLAVRELAEEVKNSVTLPQLFEAIMVLAGKGTVLIAQPDVVSKVQANTRKINNFFVSKSYHSQAINYLVSSLTSTAVQVSRFDQLFILGLKQKRKTAAELSAFAWSVIKPTGQKLAKGGKAIEDDDGNLSELKNLASNFLNNKASTLDRLDIKI